MTDASSPPADAAAPHGARDWWLRTLLVLQRPRPVFVALREDSREDVSDRAEPILLVVWLAGIAVIMFGLGTYLDGGGRDGLDLAVWVFLGGGIYGFFGYFVFGGLLHLGVKAFGSQGSYRRSRQVLAFALVPVALSLVLWPVKLSLYGEDWFRTGGGDAGGAGSAFDLLTYAFFAWSAVLLVAGVRSVHGWPWPRALAATVLPVVAPLAAALVLATL
jgi:hypothetical protein